MALHPLHKEPLPPGLTEATAEVFEQISELECIKGLYLCGGTAQSIQMDHRLSEDLDFELIDVRKERPQLPFNPIIEEVRRNFTDAQTNILGNDHFEIFINKKQVKLSFYRPENPVKRLTTGFMYNNLKAPDLQDLLGMKLYTLCVRTTFRDYYDIYCLLEKGCRLKDAIAYASYLSRHEIRSKNMLSRLITPQLFERPDDFDKMIPKYDVSSEEISKRALMAIQEEEINYKTARA